MLKIAPSSPQRRRPNTSSVNTTNRNLRVRKIKMAQHMGHNPGDPLQVDHFPIKKERKTAMTFVHSPERLQHTLVPESKPDEYISAQNYISEKRLSTVDPSRNCSDDESRNQEEHMKKTVASTGFKNNKFSSMMQSANSQSTYQASQTNDHMMT